MFHYYSESIYFKSATTTQSTLYTKTNMNDNITKDLQSDCYKDQEALLFSEEHRKVCKISQKQKMMVVIAYSSPFQH